MNLPSYGRTGRPLLSRHEVVQFDLELEWPFLTVGSDRLELRLQGGSRLRLLVHPAWDDRNSLFAVHRVAEHSASPAGAQGRLLEP